MAKDKKSFLLYCDLIHTVNKLSDEQAGKLLKHILSYVNNENPVANDVIIDLVFEPIKQQLKRDLKKYEGTCETNKENILKRWNKTDTPVYEPIRPNTNDTDIEKDMDSDSDIGKDIDTKKNKIIANKVKFELFRIAYIGTKRGLDTEFDNFIKSNDAEIIDLLLPALKKEIAEKQRLKDAKQFCPEWKNLKTWIYQKCWEQEFTEPEKLDMSWGGSHETSKQEFKEI